MVAPMYMVVWMKDLGVFTNRGYDVQNSGPLSHFTEGYLDSHTLLESAIV